MTTRITVDVPDRALFPITDRAETFDMTVAEYLVQAALAVAGVTETRLSTVERLNRLGFTDAQIADRLQTTLLSVATQRRALHLPPNRRYPHHEKSNA